jgi:hypothetical protein
MVGIFPPGLGMAAGALAQTIPEATTVPPPPVAGPMAGAGASAAVDSGLGSLPRDRSRERERPCKCPPENGGKKIRRGYSMNPEPRRYQARITGFEYGITTDGKGRETRDGWNMEWFWEGINFDGFQDKHCLLQEAKANYDQFLDKKGKSLPFFEGFDDMVETIEEQGAVVRLNPHTKLMWYFQTPKTRELMLPTLQKCSVPSVYQP